MTPAEFLNTLWGDPVAGQILIWRMPSKLSTWTNRAPVGVMANEQMQRFLTSHREDEIYTGVSLAAPDVKLGAFARTSNATSYGIAGLWADIDVVGEGHKKANLPPHIEAAQSTLDQVGYPPTITVLSGYGLQCWWLFKEPWIFKDDSEREVAQALTQAWHEQVLAPFQAQGWTVDATHDLARVMRLPGTYNHKGGGARPVTVIGQTDFRWSTLPHFMKTEPVKPARVAQIYSGTGVLALSADLEPPADKMAIMMDMIPEFAKSWRLQRTDFKGGDQSASVYDQSLATWAAMAGWSDQEIVALLVAHRRNCGEDLKLRQDYYERTIAKARSS